MLCLGASASISLTRRVTGCTGLCEDSLGHISLKRLFTACSESIATKAGTARDPAGSRARLVQSRATLPDFVPRCRRSWQKPLSLRTMETPHHATLALRLPLDQGRKTQFFSFGKEILTRPPVLCLRGCCFRGDAVPPRLLFLRPLLPFSQLSPTRVLTVEQAATSLGGL